MIITVQDSYLVNDDIMYITGLMDITSSIIVSEVHDSYCSQYKQYILYIYSRDSNDVSQTEYMTSIYQLVCSYISDSMIILTVYSGYDHQDSISIVVST